MLPATRKLGLAFQYGRGLSTLLSFSMSFVQTVLQRQAEKKADEQRRRRERKRKKGGGPAEVLLRKILKKQNKLTNL